MEEQEWRRHARRHAPSRTTHSANGALSPRGANGNAGLSAPTIASSNKSVLKQKEQRKAGGTAAAATPLAPPSRWKEMRQAVRIKATIDTDDRRMRNARIADLCEEDREKVAKLIRRIVEVGAMHEESEVEFNRQRTLMETEIRELRAHVKEDAREIDELSDKLKAALEKLRDYQERVLVLEESNELEVKHRMETDQTVDLLKAEVDKLRKLVRKQKEEMESKESEQRHKHREEMERMTQELKETHDLLLQERRERLAEKQKELEDRIQRSSTPSTVAAAGGSVEPNRYDDPPAQATAGVAMEPSQRDGVSPFEMSSFLNMSAEMPEKIKEIMDEWKARMENALNTTAASIAEGADTREATASTACQTDDALTTPAFNHSHVQQQEFERSTRRHFDSHLTAKTPRRSQSPGSASSSSSRELNERTRRVPPHPQPVYQEERSVTRALLNDFVQPSVLIDDDSFEDEVESTIALIDAMHSSPEGPGRSTARPRPARNLNLYESSLLDVVDAIESPEANSPRGHQSSPTRYSSGANAEAESPTLRVERLIQGLRIREQKLARVSAHNQHAQAEEPSFLDDVELFNDVRDVYEQDLDQGRREELLLQNDVDSEDEATDEEADDDRDRYVQDAIERDMEELLREQRRPRQLR